MTERPRPNLRTGSARRPTTRSTYDDGPRAIVAKFDSTCLVCTDPIAAGTHRIAQHDEGPWVHEDCVGGDIEPFDPHNDWWA